VKRGGAEKKVWGENKWQDIDKTRCEGGGGKKREARTNLVIEQNELYHKRGGGQVRKKTEQNKWAARSK